MNYSIDLPLLEFMYLDEGAFDNIVDVTAKSIQYDLYCLFIDVHPVYLFRMVISGKDAFRNINQLNVKNNSRIQYSLITV